MNSVTKHLTAESLAARLKAMRSAKKEVFLIVEGSDDIALFSAVFDLPPSNFVDCLGKERLMELISLIPHMGLDDGTILIRDRDHDGVSTFEKSGVAVIVVDLYDVEMHLISSRAFGRLVAEFMRPDDLARVTKEVLEKILKAAAYVGSLKLISTRDQLGLTFKDLEFSFVDRRSLDVDASELVRVVLARSHRDPNAREALVTAIEGMVGQSASLLDLASGKDALKVLQIAFHRSYRCCATAAECSPEVLGRTMRVAYTLADASTTAFYSALKKKVANCGYSWIGAAL